MHSKILDVYMTRMRYSLTEAWNSLAYFFSKLPLLGKFFSSGNYHFPRIKAILMGGAPIFHWMMSIAKSILYCFLIAQFSTAILFLFVPTASVNATRLTYNAILMLYFMWSLLSLRTMVVDQTSHVFLHDFRCSVIALARNSFCFERIEIFLARTIAFVIVLSNLPLLERIAMSFFILTTNAVVESLLLLLYAKKNIHLGQKPQYTFGSLGFGILLYLPVALIHVDYLSVLTHPIAVGIAVVALVLSTRYAWNYKKYPRLARASLLLYEQAIAKAQKGGIRAAGIKLKDTDLSAKDGNVLSKTIANEKEGFALLNTLFFRRHKRILQRPLQIKAIIISLLGMICTGFLIYNRIVPTVSSDFLVILSSYLMGAIPFIMYLMCNSGAIAQSMFVNCDVALLKQKFYRVPESILEMFQLRLLSLLRMNTFPTGLLMGFFTVWALLVGGDIWMNWLIIEVLILSFGIFFTVHTLFLYYIFQPYSDDGVNRSPFYSVANVLTYAICYGLLIANVQGRLIAIVMIFVTIIYSFVAMRLIYHFAPKTFHLR